MAMQHFARVVDTRLGAHSNATIKYVVEEGAQNVAYVPLRSSSHNNQLTNFNLNNIAQFVARDSRLNIEFTATATITLDNSTGGALNAITADNFGMRQFGWNRTIASMQHKINQATYTLQTSQILDSIARLNILSENANFYDNTQPDCIDNFSTASGTALSPLGPYTDVPQGNGSFKPRTLNYTVSGNSIPANSTGAVTITVKIYEPVISPWNNIGDTYSEALYAINGEILNISYSPVSTLFDSMFNFVAPAGLTISSVTPPSVDYGTSAQLKCVYLTAYPDMIEEIPRQSIYHYNDYVQYQNAIGIQGVDLAPGAELTGVSSQVCNFTNIPQKILVYARPAQKSASCPDVYLTIKNIQAVFDNGQPMLTAASPDQLYEISKEAGLTMERANFLGKVLNPSLVAGGAEPIHGCGSILVLDPAMVLSVRQGATNGSAGRYVFQIQGANLINNTSQTFKGGAVLFVIGVTNAILERNGSEYRNYNLNVPYDVFQKARQLSPVSAAVYNSEKFDNLFLNGGGIGDFFKRGLNLAKSGLSKALNYAVSNPHQVQQALQYAKQKLGKGGALKVKKGLHDIHPQRDMDLYFE